MSEFIHDGDIDYSDSKRGRGRPKGSKNKIGHKAGRPKKTAEDELEHGSLKRARSESISPVASTSNDLDAQDIPVDPALQPPYTYQPQPAYFHPPPTRIPPKTVKEPHMPPEPEASLTTIIRSLLPRETSDSPSKISGPFQLIEENGIRRLEGPIRSSIVDAITGPVFVYVANYAPGPHDELDLSSATTVPVPTGPAPLASWKITHPLTSEGKDRVRGPRRCGHCGKLECRGRGGRTWCSEFKAGGKSALGRIKGSGNPGGIGDENEGEVESQQVGEDALDAQEVHHYNFSIGQEDETSEEALQQQQQEIVMTALIQNIHQLVPDGGSLEHHHLFGGGGTSEEEFRNPFDVGEFGDEGGQGEDQEETEFDVDREIIKAAGLLQ